MGGDLRRRVVRRLVTLVRPGVDPVGVVSRAAGLAAFMVGALGFGKRAASGVHAVVFILRGQRVLAIPLAARSRWPRSWWRLRAHGVRRSLFRDLRSQAMSRSGSTYRAGCNHARRRRAREHDPVGRAALQRITVCLQKATDEGLQVNGGLPRSDRCPPLRASILPRPELRTRKVAEQTHQLVPRGRGVGAPTRASSSCTSIRPSAVARPRRATVSSRSPSDARSRLIAINDIGDRVPIVGYTGAF